MSQAADSAGIPFDGREFRPHPFDGDDGSAPEVLARALSGWQGEQSAEAMVDVVEALRESRVLVPLLAEAGEFGLTDEGKTVDKTQELSIVSVKGPDGKPVAVCFSDVEAMATWNPSARQCYPMCGEARCRDQPSHRRPVHPTLARSGSG
jgi:hypothetical protein